MVKNMAKSIASLGLFIGLLVNPVAFAADAKLNNELNNEPSKEQSHISNNAIDNKAVNVKINSKDGVIVKKNTDVGGQVDIEHSKIIFERVGPNEQVISMDILKGYRNLHQNLRRRNISLSDRRISTKVAVTDSEVSK